MKVDFFGDWIAVVSGRNPAKSAPNPMGDAAEKAIPAAKQTVAAEKVAGGLVNGVSNLRLYVGGSGAVLMAHAAYVAHEAASDKSDRAHVGKWTQALLAGGAGAGLTVGAVIARR